MVKNMSIKKEILDELTEQQLRNLAENRGIKFNLSKRQEEYYHGWDEKDKLVDIMTDNQELKIKDIENYLNETKSQNF